VSDADVESLVLSELLDDVEPELSDCSEGQIVSLATLRQQRWRAQRDQQIVKSKLNPVVHVSELAF
jgi:hypothetical protein